jgi:LEA14-like dessication related protein
VAYEKLEEEVVSKLKQWCGEASMWTQQKEVIEKFKTSSMWVEWVKAGLSEGELGQTIARLKTKFSKPHKMNT